MLNEVIQITFYIWLLVIFSSIIDVFINGIGRIIQKKNLGGNF